MDSLLVSPHLMKRHHRERSKSTEPYFPPLQKFESNIEEENIRNELNYTFEDIDRDIGFFITETENKLKNLKEKTPQETETPKRIYYKRPRKTLEKVQNTIINFFNKPNRLERKEKEKEDLVQKIQRELGEIREPCIDDIYERICLKQRLFEDYKNEGRFYRSKSHNSANSKYSMALIKKSAPLPVLSYIKNNSLVLNRYNLHHTICKGLGNALTSLNHLKVLHLDECGISDKGASFILKGMASSTKIQSFFYTKNEIGPLFAKKFKKMIQNCKLKEINLKGCKTGTGNLKLVLHHISRCRSLKKLYISELGLNNSEMEKIGAALRRRNLIELDLSWNQITQEASREFFEKLKRNRQLRFLDYSFNRLNSNDGEIGFLLGMVIAKHPRLMHLNLSYTKMNDGDLSALAKPISLSKTLIGIHLTGNPFSFRILAYFSDILQASDSLAFKANSKSNSNFPIKIEFEKPSLESPKSYIPNISLKNRAGRRVVCHRDNIVDITRPTKERDFLVGGEHPEIIFSRILGADEIKDGQKWVSNDHCWICERWTIHKFVVYTENLVSVAPVKAFKFRNIWDEKMLIKSSFNDWKEIPLEETGPEKFEVSLLLPPGSHWAWFLYENKEVYVNTEYRRSLWNGFTTNEFEVPMRVEDLEVNIQEIETDSQKFNKEKSVFRAFIEDTDRTRLKMFQNDKKYFKFERMIKNKEQIEPLYEYLISQYAEIKEIFDHLAAVSNYPCIGWLDFSNFCDFCSISDKKHMNTAAIDRIFIAVNFEVEALDDNPDRELCRYEFFEVLVRIAMCKYQDLPLTPTEATRKLMDECIYIFAETSKASEFRREELYHLDVNDILEANISIIETLFGRYKERSGRWISLEGIERLIKESGIKIEEKNLRKCFAFSKMSILDEMEANGAHNKMLFVEFLEFIGRFANEIYEEESSLSEKIEMTLTEILSKNGLRIKLPSLEEKKNSDSDSEDD